MAEVIISIQERINELLDELSIAEAEYNKAKLNYDRWEEYRYRCARQKQKTLGLYNCSKNINPPGLTQASLDAEASAARNTWITWSTKISSIKNQLVSAEAMLEEQIDITSELAELELVLGNNDATIAKNQEEAARKRFQTYAIPALILVGIIFGFRLFLKNR